MRVVRWSQTTFRFCRLTNIAEYLMDRVTSSCRGQSENEFNFFLWAVMSVKWVPYLGAVRWFLLRGAVRQLPKASSSKDVLWHRQKDSFVSSFMSPALLDVATSFKRIGTVLPTRDKVVFLCHSWTFFRIVNVFFSFFQVSFLPTTGAPPGLYCDVQSRLRSVHYDAPATWEFLRLTQSNHSPKLMITTKPCFAHVPKTTCEKHPGMGVLRRRSFYKWLFFNVCHVRLLDWAGMWEKRVTSESSQRRFLIFKVKCARF